MESLPETAMTRRVARRLAILIIIGFAINLLMVVYIFYSSYQRRVHTVATQRAGCERSKLDRKDDAAFQTAQKTYIVSVTGAVSVKNDVKTAARKAIVVFQKTAEDLTVRSKIDCQRAYPDATLFP